VRKENTADLLFFICYLLFVKPVHSVHSVHMVHTVHTVHWVHMSTINRLPMAIGKNRLEYGHYGPTAWGVGCSAISFCEVPWDDLAPIVIGIL